MVPISKEIEDKAHRVLATHKVAIFLVAYNAEKKIQKVISRIPHWVAEKVSETDTPVLLLGETGTGKELFAQAIHYSSLRKNKPFLAINCSAIAKDLLESEMFGYKAGAFTGAIKNKKGLFEEANLGTLFLDEIGELDLSLQAKFLRVLETNDFIKPYTACNNFLSGPLKGRIEIR